MKSARQAHLNRMNELARQRNAGLTALKKQQRDHFVKMNARYDLADFDDEINEQFARARPESGNTGLNQGELRRMVDRSRHEIYQANGWLKGTVRSATVSIIGRGPEVELRAFDIDEERPSAETTRQVSRVERLFNRFLRKRKCGRKFRVMANAKQSDGTGLAMIFDSTVKVDRISLDFHPFDRDHIRPPKEQLRLDRTEYLLYGKEYDDNTHEPSTYWVSPKHPVEHPESEPVPIPAKFILDVWDWMRPSQGHGAPEYATVIKNGPLSRAYRRATLDAATTAAKHTAIMETSVDTFADGNYALDDMANWVTVPTQYGMLTALPMGWKLNQMKAEQPHTSHAEFMRSLAAEAGRATNQPAHISLGDGGGMNMSSQQGLRTEWETEVGCQRQDWETEALNKLLEHWLREAAAINLIPKKFGTIDAFDVEYRWTKRRHEDTNREYQGRAASVVAGLRSRESWLMEDGRNPEFEDATAAEGYGVTEEQYKRAVFINTFGDAAREVLGLPTTAQGGATQEQKAKPNAGAGETNGKPKRENPALARGGN